MSTETEPYSEAELQFAEECLKQTTVPGLGLTVEQTAYMIRLSKRLRAEHSHADRR